MQEMEPITGSRPPDNIAVEVKDMTMTWGSAGDASLETAGEQTALFAGGLLSSVAKVAGLVRW